MTSERNLLTVIPLMLSGGVLLRLEFVWGGVIIKALPRLQVDRWLAIRAAAEKAQDRESGGF